MHPAEELFEAWMTAVGFASDPEMQDTARRVTEFMQGFSGAEAPVPLATFAADASGPIVLRDLPFHSLCAHHLLPFFGTATVAYQPAGRLAGFSTIARVVQSHAARPQIQERLGEQLCAALYDKLQPEGLVVHLRARQLCMEMRGAHSPGEAEVFASRGSVAALMAIL